MTSRRPTMVLVGTLDTNGPEHAFVRDRLLEAGVDVTVVDVGSPRDTIPARHDVPERPGAPDRSGSCIRATLRQGVPWREIEANINEPAFADAATATFLELFAVRRPSLARREA